MNKLFLAGFLCLASMTCINAQETFPLYEGAIPNSTSVPDREKKEVREGGIAIVSNISIPTLTVFKPPSDKANGTAVIICPGGGYWVNAISHEGYDVAREFTEMGVTAFVLKYRIPDDKGMTDKKTGPLQDAQRAISMVRKNASKWNIDQRRIGIMGFSAGGHLASTAGTHFEKPILEYGTDVRPDFMILIYPVISFQTEVGHPGSRDQLIGKEPQREIVDLFSNELQVNEKTPPAFLVHAVDDDVVNVENSTLFFNSLRRSGVPAEMHLFQKGGHGFGLKNRATQDEWMPLCRSWMILNGWIKESK